MNGMNFSPDQMRMASDMMKNMKDEDIKRMMGMMGGPSIDPSLLRNFASQMGSGGPTPPPQRSQQNEYTPPPAQKKEEPKPAAEPEPAPKFNPYEKIEKIKNRGNKLYEAQRYKEACQLYFEGIMEVEDMFDNGVKRNPEITAIELSCRRNYALGKIAQKEFRDAHSMLEEVLKIAPEDPKALIKISECSLELGQPQAAGTYLERCRMQLQGEEQWKSLQKRVLADFPASDLKPSTDNSSHSQSPHVIELACCISHNCKLLLRKSLSRESANKVLNPRSRLPHHPKRKKSRETMSQSRQHYLPRLRQCLPKYPNLVIASLKCIKTRKKGYAAHLDFSEYHTRVCAGHENPDSSSSDYTKFVPHTYENAKCFNGMNGYYIRKRPEAKCINPDHFDFYHVNSFCKCTDRDWECDNGFSREPGSVVCVQDPHFVLETGPPALCSGYYHISNGYRKVSGNSCQGGVDHSPNYIRCPGQMGIIGAFFGLIWTLIVWLLYGAVGYFAFSFALKKYREYYLSNKEGAQEARDVAGPGEATSFYNPEQDGKNPSTEYARIGEKTAPKPESSEEAEDLEGASDEEI